MSGYLIMVGLILAAAIWYVAHCALFPFAACWRCDGAGRRSSRSGRAWRRCGRCRGTGARVRIGRRVWDYLRARHRDSHD